MSIIISQNGKKALKVDKSNFEKEGYLQNYIHENPESIPVYEIEEDKKLFVVAREFQTESGPIDALAIDRDGDIYVVETKLYKNPDKRTVVAQALDYGASLWRHSDYNEFIAKINIAINQKFKMSLEEKAKEFFNLDYDGVIAMLENIKGNFSQGNIKFVILMDFIEDRLKDLIIYINQNSHFDIYAVQMEYYKYEQYEIMIPKLFGLEVKKNISNTSNSPRKKWDEEGFFEEAKKVLSGNDLETIIKLFNFSKESADEIKWGTGVNQSSFSVRFHKLGNKPLFVISSDGKLKISTEYPKREASPEQINRLDRLNLAFKNIGMVINSESERTTFETEKWIDNVDGIINNISDAIV
ncbi:MAG: hypothetical protein WC244_04035 [Patescibacteria group bacterium]|jgi:hypothetical protein